ncbi:MAG: hypothetical protein ABSA23_09055 [Anaerolineales bacterium]
MKLITRTFMIYFLGIILVSCAKAIESTPSSEIIPTTTKLGPTSVPTPFSMGTYLLTRLPSCDGIQILEKPIVFDWPNIQERLQELSGAFWGYYSCNGPQAQVAAFYRAKMPKPPYNMNETNWVVRVEGTVGVYYNDASKTWIYLWVVAQPNNPQKSYVIVADTTDPVSGECRLERPNFYNDIAAGELE